VEDVVTDPTGPLDDTDRALLDRLAAVAGRVDPVPADLDDRVLFALALDDPDALAVEVARLGDEQLVGSGARAADRTRTITFDAESRTIMVTLVERPDGRVRIDGWLAPPVAVPVELRLAGTDAGEGAGDDAGEGAGEGAGIETVSSDETGRFVFDRVPHGLAQLRVGAPAGGARVVTPSLVL
jgi:hypothetical protein